MSTTLYREIPLTLGKFALVDEEDYARISSMKWQAHWDKTTNSFRAMRSDYETGRKRGMYMHREIIGLKWGDRRKCDHRNHDTLDNRKINLRIASNSENCMNRRHRKGSKSPKKCVQQLPSGNWRARVCVNGTRVHLGVRETYEEAYILYCEGAKRAHGEFACTP